MTARVADPTGRLRAAATLLLLAGAAHADSNGAPVGAEFQVNTYTTSAQRYAAVAAVADGDFVVVWESRGSNGDDSDFDSIQGQRFSAAGIPQGGEFQINTYTTLSQLDPAVATDAAGDFVVVWQSYGSSGSDSSAWSIQGQRFSSAGVPQDDEFQVNGYTLGVQQNPSVGVAPNGDFVVVWDSSQSSGDSDNFSVQGRRYSAAGEPQGGQFQVNTYTTLNQIFPVVAAGPDGSFVIAWQSRGSNGTDSDFYSVQAQRYSADGTPQGAEFQVNTYTTAIQGDASIAMDGDGDFVIVWKSNGSSGTDHSSYSIQGQRYSASGVAEGAEFQVNTYTTSFQQIPRVAAREDGEFVVAWQSNGSSGTDHSLFSIQGQRFSEAGVPQGPQFQVNSYTFADQKYPAVAIDGSGAFVVAWQGLSSSGGDNTENVQARQFRLSLFSDGFESGSTGAWSGVAP